MIISTVFLLKLSLSFCCLLLGWDLRQVRIWLLLPPSHFLSRLSRRLWNMKWTRKRIKTFVMLGWWWRERNGDEEKKSSCRREWSVMKSKGMFISLFWEQSDNGEEEKGENHLLRFNVYKYNYIKHNKQRSSLAHALLISWKELKSQTVKFCLYFSFIILEKSEIRNFSPPTSSSSCTRDFNCYSQLRLYLVCGWVWRITKHKSYRTFRYLTASQDEFHFINFSLLIH